MRDRRGNASMVCKKEVIAWFSDLRACRRIDFLCALMDCCSSTEWRFLGTYVEALCRRDYDSLREAELSANDVSYLSKLTSATDKRILDKVLTSLALMNSRCTEGARVLFNMLQEHTEAILNGHDEQILCSTSNEKSHVGPSNKSETDEKVVLLAVMAVNHPAFTFSQKLAIRDKLSALLQAVESEAASEPEGTESSPVTAAECTQPDLVTTTQKTPKANDDRVLKSKAESQIGHIEMDSMRVRQSDKRYECVFKVHWLDGSISTVGKTHAQLFDFQGKLLQLFPKVNNEERLIPYIPGEMTGKHIFSGAQARESTEKPIPKEFHEYVRTLSALPKSILHCYLMRDFFKEEYSLGGNTGTPAKDTTTSTPSANTNSSLTIKTAPVSNQEPEQEEPPTSLQPGECSKSTGHQAVPLQTQGSPVAMPPTLQVHPASPASQQVHPLTASLRHLEISHHQNVNLTPSNPLHVSPNPTINQLTGTAQLPASGPIMTATTTAPSESNSVYFQSISSAISIPTPTEMYTNPSAGGDNLPSVNQQALDDPVLVKAQGSPCINSASYATPLPNTCEAFSPKEGDGTPSAGDIPSPAMSATPVAVSGVQPLPPPHHQPVQPPMVCYTASSNQPLNPSALPKSAVAPEVQDWLKQQRLHKYEHFFEGLSIKQVIELTDEDIDKWESITEGAKGRFKGHFEQLRQSLLQNGVNTPAEPQHLVPPPVTFMHPMTPQYYVIPPGMMITPPCHVTRAQECQPRSDNSSSGSAGSRDSSDECERDSENDFVSQDVRAQCNQQPKRKHGPHAPRHQHGRIRHGMNKHVPKPTYSPLVYSQVLKSPNLHPRNPRHGAPAKGLLSESPIHLGQHPHVVMNNANNIVPAHTHTVMLPLRMETPSAIDGDGPPVLGPQGQHPKVGPGHQTASSQPNMARTQMSPVPPHMHGPPGLGWHPPSGNGIGPGNIIGTHMVPGQQVTSMPQVLTSPVVQLEQYTHNPSPQQRVDGPQHTPPMVQIKANRHPVNNNHYGGEDGMGYRTFNTPPSSVEAAVQGQVSQSVRSSDGNFVVSAPLQTSSNPKNIYTNSPNQSGNASPGPSSHAPSENFGVTSTTTYVQAGNQNTVSVVTTSLGMMQMAYSNPMVLAQSPGPCTCNNNGGNSVNQSCSLHQGHQTNALLPNPTYLPYPNFFQSPYIHPVNFMKGPGGPNSPRYMSPYHSPSAVMPTEMLYGAHYGGTVTPQGHVFINQMGVNQRGPHGPEGKKPPMNCFNCGKQGHKANECRENTMENITQKCQYRLNYKPEATDS